jgi:hypothetical protein
LLDEKQAKAVGERLVPKKIDPPGISGGVCFVDGLPVGFYMESALGDSGELVVDPGHDLGGGLGTQANAGSGEEQGKKPMEHGRRYFWLSAS